MFFDFSIIKSTDHVDFKNLNLDRSNFVHITSYTAVGEQLTAKNYVDEAISNSVDESSLIRLDLDEKLEPCEQVSMILTPNLTSRKTKVDIPTKAYVNSLHKNSRSRQDSSTVLKYQDNEFDKIKFKKLDSIMVSRDATTNNEISTKK